MGEWRVSGGRVACLSPVWPARLSPVRLGLSSSLMGEKVARSKSSKSGPLLKPHGRESCTAKIVQTWASPQASWARKLHGQKSCKSGPLLKPHGRESCTAKIVQAWASPNLGLSSSLVGEKVARPKSCKSGPLLKPHGRESCTTKIVQIWASPQASWARKSHGQNRPNLGLSSSLMGDKAARPKIGQT